MVWEERRVPPNVNPILPPPPPGFEWPPGIGWQGTEAEALDYMVKADSQRVFSQIVAKQREWREAREAGK